ncbi:MAG: flippase-like domain-containing protein, partial [Firmicutes bacterium]|nr:flippase-like domain-containing protein [Bacillota bacterium]
KRLGGVLGFNQPVKDYIFYYFAGMFFNHFLPGTVGGDVVRAIGLAKDKAEVPKSAVTVLADRGTGFLALMLIASIGVMVMRQSLQSWIAGLTYLVTLILLLGFLIPYSSRVPVKKLSEKTRKTLKYWENLPILGNALILSLIFQLIVVIIHIFLGKAVGISVPIWYYFVFTPLVAAVSMIPISINGLGVREGAYIYFLTRVAVTKDTALAFGMGWLIVVLVSSLVGGVMLLIRPMDWKVKK